MVVVSRGVRVGDDGARFGCGSPSARRFSDSARGCYVTMACMETSCFAVRGSCEACTVCHGVRLGTSRTSSHVRNQKERTNSTVHANTRLTYPSILVPRVTVSLKLFELGVPEQQRGTISASYDFAKAS